jgi:hypothetical protein
LPLTEALKQQNTAGSANAHSREKNATAAETAINLFSTWNLPKTASLLHSSTAERQTYPLASAL